MKYSYFPGCSLKAGSVGYDLSSIAMSRVIQVELVELDDWNCCGATAYTSIAELNAFCLSARNLALAEKEGHELVSPCSACYTALRKTNTYLNKYPSVKQKVGKALAAGDLSYQGEVTVRHLVEVLTINDEIRNTLKDRIKVSLSGLKVASYHGCQLVRPTDGFDHPEYPRSLDQLMTTIGAEAVYYPISSRCCGGSMIVSRPEFALELIYKLLRCAVDNGAECIVTACPLCQVNLDAYQGTVNSKFKTKFHIPVLYFPQLVGLALGLKSEELGIPKNIVSATTTLAPYLS